MKGLLKICKNGNCGEILGCFPIKKCKFCQSNDLAEVVIDLKFVDGIDNPYYEENAAMAEFEYLGARHAVVRVPLGVGNDCDYNGGYLHYMCI